MKNLRVTPHKIAIVDRALSGAYGFAFGERIRRARNRGESVAADNPQSRFYHGMCHAWSWIVTLGIHQNP